MLIKVDRFHGFTSNSVLRFSLREHGPAYRLSAHFVLVEFASKDGADEVLVHPAAVSGLEVIRKKFGRPILLTSAYRSPAHNKAIGGAKRSPHMSGFAVDTVVIGVPPYKVAAFAETMHWGGIGRYPMQGFTHLDVFEENRRWRK